MRRFMAWADGEVERVPTDKLDHNSVAQNEEESAIGYADMKLQVWHAIDRGDREGERLVPEQFVVNVRDVDTGIVSRWRFPVVWFPELGKVEALTVPC